MCFKFPEKLNKTRSDYNKKGTEKKIESIVNPKRLIKKKRFKYLFNSFGCRFIVGGDYNASILFRDLENEKKLL